MLSETLLVPSLLATIIVSESALTECAKVSFKCNQAYPNSRNSFSTSGVVCKATGLRRAEQQRKARCCRAHKAYSFCSTP